MWNLTIFHSFSSTTSSEILDITSNCFILFGTDVVPICSILVKPFTVTSQNFIGATNNLEAVSELLA